MQKITFLLPPSEWKNLGWELNTSSVFFEFEKPYSIAINATEKDLKCKSERFKEWIDLNLNIEKGFFMEAIKRYKWVMFNAINYSWMNDKWKKFFENNFLILSGMYWLVKPLDVIWNYKLPIETKWLYKFWWDKITNKLNELNPDYIINLLPISYSKMLNFDKLNSKIININFLTEKNWKIVKVSHWVKKIKWEWIKNICEKEIYDYWKFWWEIIREWKIININIKK